jgi:uncharacterized protein YkwD
VSKARALTGRTRVAGIAAGLVLATTTIGLVPGWVGPAHAAGGSPVTGFAPSPSGHGFWTVASDGDVVASGDARDLGDMVGQPLARPIVGMTATPDGGGYWLVASDGGVFSFGNARFLGSTGDVALNQPIVGMGATPSGHGYWLVASDGGIFAFGDARFFGSTGDVPLVQPIVALAPTASGTGYWLVASDGGIFAFGDAAFHGSVGGQSRGDTVVGMAATAGAGYWLVTGSGQVFAFGDAPALGSAPGLGAPVVGILRSGGGYAVAAADGSTAQFSPSGTTVAPAPAPVDRPGAIAREIFDLVNRERADRGLAPLRWDPQLAVLARQWSTEMAQRAGLAHGGARWAIGDPGFSGFRTLAENIGTGVRGTSGGIHDSWMRSELHRANVLQPGFDSIGIGVVCVDGTIWATQEFGRQRASAAPAMSNRGAPPPGAVLGGAGGTGC